MSPLWRKQTDLDELLSESKDLRRQLLLTVEALDEFVERLQINTERAESESETKDRD